MTRYCCLNLLTIYLIAQLAFTFSSTMKSEKELLAALTANYDPNVHPSIKAVEVKFDLRLTKIVKLDIKDQQLHINARILMKWTDSRLRWNNSEYNIVGRLVVPASLFWTPDILLYNTANEESVSSSDVYKANLQIDEAGRVIWMSPVTLRSSCDINVKWFPFDTQSCSLLFGSVSMTMKKLGLRFYSKPKSIAAFQDKFHYSSGVWRVKTLSSTLRNELYSCCKEPFSLIEFKLLLKRIPMYYVLYLILPCLCLSLLSPCIFFVPPETGERIGFGITIVLSMSVYLLVISDKLPEKSNESPLIGVLYIELFFIMIGTLIAAIYTTHMAFRTNEAPCEMRNIFCNTCRSEVRKRKEINANKTRKKANIIVVDEAVKIKNYSNEVARQNCVGLAIPYTASNPCDIPKPDPPEGKDSEFQEQWKEIARGIDYVNFWTFLVVTICLPFLTTLFYLA